ncbi:unnamed protein product [Calypogeia fissa]
MTSEMEPKKSRECKLFGVDMNPWMDHTSFQAPGDVVLDLTQGGSVVRLGRGLRQEGDSIVVTRPGRLRQTIPNKYWVEGSQKRYVSNVEDGCLA